MTNAEKEYVDEIKRLKDAIDRTKSQYLKRDYSKRLNRMNKELKEYRSFRYGV